jgi:hypothetical protein
MGSILKKKRKGGLLYPTRKKLGRFDVVFFDGVPTTDTAVTGPGPAR